MTTRTRLLTAKDLAERWGCSPSSIYGRARRAHDPLPKAGPVGVRFDLRQAEEWRRRNIK